MMRKKKLIFVLVFCMLFLTGCGKEKESGEEYRIYYLDTEEAGLVEESCAVSAKSTESRIEEVLELLAKQPDTIDYKSVFIHDVKVTDWARKMTKLDIHFNEKYRELDPVSELLLRASVVQSLVQIPGVSYVRFFVGDAPLTDRQGKETGYMRGEDFVQNTGSSLHSYQTADLRLYFSNGQGDGLVSEEVSVRYNSNMSIEKVITEQLLKGPSAPDAKAAIPPDTKLLSVSVKDRICYVNFDEGFLNIAEQVNPRVTVYSLVNSIIDAGGAEQVQILVNGEVNIVYQETVDLQKPLSENMELVEVE